ncbi:MAG: dihydrofolate reductase family protein [Clostridia bacterium]|nr:dihydrofolate reductase family protein [Clostridia bacterium]
MNRPYIICHMVTSIDGKVTGDFLFGKGCALATDVYYRINRRLKADGFICGRVTMEGSFTGGYYPDLSKYPTVSHGAEAKADFIPKKEDMSNFYAVAFDTNGRLGWQSARIIDPDGDIGYDGAQIIEVLSEDVDGRYLGYLQAMGIPYIFAGEKAIDVNTALSKLKSIFGCDTLLLEGGSIINGAFQRAGAVDELSLVTAPTVAGENSSPLFYHSDIMDFELKSAETEDGVLILRYTRKSL